MLLLVNFLCAYFLLLGAGALGGARAAFGRMLAGAALAAVSALILFAPPLPYPLQIAYKILTGGVVSAAAYGVRPVRRWLAVSCWFAALNIALAGAALLLMLRTGTDRIKTGNLAVYLRVSPLLLIGSAALCCLVVQLSVVLLGHRRTTVQTRGLEFEVCGVLVHLRAMLDTGCHLKDPVSCLPVLLVSYPDARARLPQPLDDYLRAWFAGQRRQPLPTGATLRLIPCTTASGSTLLPGFAVRDICLLEADGPLALGRSTVAFAPQGFGNDAEYEALYGPEFL